MIPRVALLGGLAAALLAGCATPPPPSAVTARAALPAREPTLERDYRARAAALMQERRWADARVQFELLLLLRPGAAEYRGQLEAVQRAIADTAADANAQAVAARKRGDLEAATTHYLRALAADRDNATAAQGLREIERERVRRAYLHRPPRSVLPIIMGKPGAPAETESDYLQRAKPGNGDDTAHAVRR